MAVDLALSVLLAAEQHFACVAEAMHKWNGFRLCFADRFPDDDEGSMTNTANTLVSNRAHVLYANYLHLTRYIAQNLGYQRPNQR